MRFVLAEGFAFVSDRVFFAGVFGRLVFYVFIYFLYCFFVDSVLFAFLVFFSFRGVWYVFSVRELLGSFV